MCHVYSFIGNTIRQEINVNFLKPLKLSQHRKKIIIADLLKLGQYNYTDKYITVETDSASLYSSIRMKCQQMILISCLNIGILFTLYNKWMYSKSIENRKTENGGSVETDSEEKSVEKGEKMLLTE